MITIKTIKLRLNLQLLFKTNLLFYQLINKLYCYQSALLQPILKPMAELEHHPFMLEKHAIDSHVHVVESAIVLGHTSACIPLD